MIVWIFKQCLVGGEMIVGFWFSFGLFLLVEMMVKFGFDWFVVDMEYGILFVLDFVYMCQIIGLCGVFLFVCVGDNDFCFIK